MANIIFNQLLFLVIVGIYSVSIPATARADDSMSSELKLAQSPQLNVDEEIIASVKSAIANYFSVPVNKVTLDTDIVKDLKADYMDAYEIVAMICEEHGVVVPKNTILQTVREIAAYIDTAELKEVEFSLRGRTRPSADKKSDPIAMQKVFFATNRNATGKTEPNEYFDGQRSSLKQSMK